MTRTHPQPFAIIAFCLLAAFTLTVPVFAAEVTVALVTREVEGLRSLTEKQALWKSPFGGWVAATWPFGLQIGEREVLGFQTAAEELREASVGAGLGGGDEGIALELEEEAPDAAAPETAKAAAVPGVYRPAQVVLDPEPGEHLLEPFGIAFSVGHDGEVGCRDPRAVGAGGRLNVVCHPVRLRPEVAGRSTAAPLRVWSGETDLLAGMETLFAEQLRLEQATTQKALKPGKEAPHFLQLTLFLPASVQQKFYRVNDIDFSLTADGQITLKQEAARVKNSNELRLPAGTSLASTVKKMDAAPALPAIDPQRPRRILLADGAEQPTWVIDAPVLAAASGGRWSCRVTSLSKDNPALPGQIAARLHAVGRGAGVGIGMVLSGKGGIYTGALPDSPGLWMLAAGDGSPLAGRSLGLVWLGEGEPTGAVSFYTVRNRAVWQRGALVDILWSARSLSKAFPVRLRGTDFETTIGTVSGRATAGGSLRLDTSGLAPGWYEIGTEGAGVACYPLFLRICQREAVTDYEIYSYVYGQAQPYAGSPVRAYYGKTPEGPGLTSLLAGTDTALDPALAAYSVEVYGPAPEKFLRPTAEEARLLALAGQGMRVVLQYPTMLYHEAWNPKHTLPEELAQMRRRLGLFVQPKADVAGFGGVTMGWYATAQANWWEDVPCQDGNVARRNGAATAWVITQIEAAVKDAAANGMTGIDLEAVKHRAGLRASSSILPNAWADYLVDARQIAPDLSTHNAIPSWWLGGRHHNPDYAYQPLTGRDAVDYSDYGLTAWGNFRTPAWMSMGNREGQKLLCNFAANQMHNRIVTAFGATGRGLDGFSMPCDGEYPEGEDVALRRIFERFGSYFSALEPLSDVALYFSDTNPQNVALHDLARMGRPAMLVGDGDVLAGELAKYRVLFLVSARKPAPADIGKAFAAFETQGGIIVKDRTCHTSLPGRDLGFGYEGEQVHPVWGLAYANGEDEFAHLLKNFKTTRQAPLEKVFADIPPLPVGTSSVDAVISPLAGKESILCFVVNQALVPMDLEGKWRQYFVLPAAADLLVEQGWHVRNLLTGKATPMADAGARRKAAIDFTRCEGAIYLLTKRKPTGMAIRTERTEDLCLRLTGWLADEADKPFTDPMPFEVTLRNATGKALYHKFAALSPTRALVVPIPALSGTAELMLEVRDLILGSSATRPLSPAPVAIVEASAGPDLVGGAEAITAFLNERKGPVTILLDERQETLRPAAERLAALLKTHGRAAHVVVLDPATVPPLPLRWKPTKPDKAVLAGLADGQGFAGRVGLGVVGERDRKTGRTVKLLFDDPYCGYDEYGPRLRHDADIVLFGSPENHLALEALMPYLRRAPTATWPAPGGFFIHHLWSPFQGGYNGLYLGCRDAGGAGAAVSLLGNLKAPTATASPEKRESTPALTKGGAPTAPEDMLTGSFGRPVLNIAFSPQGEQVFATAAGYGPQLFALTPEGEVTAARELHHVRGALYQRLNAHLRALDAETVEVGLMDRRYRYSLAQGFVSRWNAPVNSFAAMKQSVPPAASPVLEAPSKGRTFLCSRRRGYALDRQGKTLWQYDDEAGRLDTDRLFHPRNLYPRAVSGDGRVLLVAAFGSRETLYAAHPANPAILGIDTTSGQVLWQKPLFLNEGEVLPLDDRFLVVDDAGTTRVYHAADGKEARLRPIKGTASVQPVPGRAELLIIDNTVFTRDGLAADVTLRPVDGGEDRRLPISGRVVDAWTAPDGESVVFSTTHGETLRLATGDGRILWRATTPTGGIVRIATNGKVLWVGTRDGVIHRLEAATGAPLGSTDLNLYNVTTPKAFVKQMTSGGEVPVATDAVTVPPVPVEPSYQKALDREKLPLGENLIKVSQRKSDSLSPDTTFALQVEAGKTYLVELLAAAAEPAKQTPQTRLHIAVKGAGASRNLPFDGFLPLTKTLTRCRAAFRADAAGDVTLTLRAVEPGSAAKDKEKQGNKARSPYTQPAPSPAGLAVDELFVGIIGFQGPNLLFDGGATAQQAPPGNLECTVQPWTGGSSLVRTKAYTCVKAAIRCVDGQIANQDGAWAKGDDGSDVATGWQVRQATAIVRFRNPQTLTAVAIYEDNTGPALSGDAIREKTAMRYGVYVRKAGEKALTYVGHVTDNTQLVNLFTCPAVNVSEIHYLWAGRPDTDRTDGPVRMVEIEAYGDETSLLLDETLDGDKEQGALEL